MNLLHLDHAQITVPTASAAAARYFYLDVLGLAEVPKPRELAGRGGFWAVLGGIQIHVGLEDGVDRGRTRAHLAFAVDDLNAWEMRLSSLGIAPLAAPPLAGRRRFELRDPFGNRLELIAADYPGA